MKEKNILDNNKLYNNNNILFSSNNKHPVNILYSKILNDNPKIFGNKNTFIKNKKLDNEKMSESNQEDLNTNIISKKIGLVNIPIKKTKYNLLNNTHRQGRQNDKRINKFLFSDSRDMIFTKLFNNSKNLRNFKNNSIDLRFKQISYSQNNTKENKANNSKKINNRNISTNNKLIRTEDFQSVKETVNKSNEEVFPSINNIEKKFKKNNVNSNSLNFSIKNNVVISYNNNNRNDEKEKKLNSLSGKEKAYYILSQSKVLRLCERIIFSRTTPKIRSLISINDIIKSNEIFIKDKIKELEQKIITYNNIIETAFSPTRTATISLNLILKDDEDDFKKLYFKDDSLDEDENKYYNIYIQLLSILLNEKFNEKNLENININIVYDKLREKGFLSFKDYLCDVFITKKFKKESINEENEKKFIELFEKLPDLIRYEGDIKNCRFISFSYFILYEFNNYLKKNKEYAQIKDKIQYYIDCLKKKISNINK